MGRTCCHREDYESLWLLDHHRALLGEELEWWHTDYLPVAGTVLDVGAGCGETALFYLRHGAKHVVAVEGDPAAMMCLRHNFGADKRVTIVEAHLNKIKIDVEGAELGMDLETHRDNLEWKLRRQAWVDGMGWVRQWRLHETAGVRL